MQLANFWFTRYAARHQYEWKVTLGVWALLAAAAPFLLDKKIAHLEYFALGVVLGHALWLRGIWAANERNLRDAFHWANQAADLLIIPSHKLTRAERNVELWEKLVGFVFNWSMLFQLTTTVGLTFLDLSLAGTQIPVPQP